MAFYLFIGCFIGFIVSFVVLKRSIYRAGCGELRMCRDLCPYYKNIEGGGDDD